MEAEVEDRVELDIERLIDAVRNLPCLWQVSCKVYKNLKARENAWKIVAREVEGTTAMCKEVEITVRQVHA